jgi:hypothetical protein
VKIVKSASEMLGYKVVYWLRHRATSRKLTGSKPDEDNDVDQFIILPAISGTQVYAASDRKEYQKQKSEVSG